MPLICTAMIGFLCVQAPVPGSVDIKLEDQGIWVANVVKTSAWSAQWGQSMEHAPPSIDVSRLTKACVGDACIAYWRQCLTGKDGITCQFVFDQNGAARSVSVVAKDQTALNQALTSLGIMAKWQSPVVAVPLAAMTTDSKGAMPVCISAPCHVPEK